MDLYVLEKVITNVHEHYDVTVSIKVQQSRSRYAKYVYYNCTQQEMKSIAKHQEKPTSCLIYA